MLFRDASPGNSGRESSFHHLESKDRLESNRDCLLAWTVLTASYGFNTNVALTKAFEDMYAFTAVNPGVPAKSQYVG